MTALSPASVPVMAEPQTAPAPTRPLTPSLRPSATRPRPTSGDIKLGMEQVSIYYGDRRAVR